MMNLLGMNTLKVCDYLDQLGYKQHEVSNFAKDGAESEHNKKYWKYESVAALVEMLQAC